MNPRNNSKFGTPIERKVNDAIIRRVASSPTNSARSGNQLVLSGQAERAEFWSITNRPPIKVFYLQKT